MKKSIVASALALSLLLPAGLAEAKTVTVKTAGDAPKQYNTEAATVGEFLQENDIVPTGGIVSFPASKTALKEGDSVELKRGYEITIADGTEEYVRSVSSNRVEDILRELSIELKEGDSVTPPLDSTVEDGEVLRINRAAEKTVTETIEIPFETITRENPELEQGTEKVVQEGVTGVIEETRVVSTVNGEEASRIVIGSTVKTEKQDRIVEVGTKVPENTIHGKKYSRKITMKGTAYDPSAGSMTASGTSARVGAVAVDPRVIPLGTKLYIESADGFPTYGFAVAEDTGGAIKGNRIDLFYNTRGEANRFGRRNVTVYVLED